MTLKELDAIEPKGDICMYHKILEQYDLTEFGLPGYIGTIDYCIWNKKTGRFISIANSLDSEIYGKISGHKVLKMCYEGSIADLSEDEKFYLGGFGFPDSFVTRCGRVWSNKSKQFLNEELTRNGYIRVKLLHESGKYYRKLRIHRLVAACFVCVLDEGLEINHENGCKTDCHADNLSQVTSKENKDHASKYIKDHEIVNGNRPVLPFDEKLEINKRKPKIKIIYEDDGRQVIFNNKVCYDGRECAI